MPKLHDSLLLIQSTRNEVSLPAYFSLYANSSDHDPDNGMSSIQSQGYYGKIYIDKIHREFIVVHRSTTLSNPQKHETASFVAVNNLSTDAEIFSQLVPHATEVAFAFVRKYLKTLPKQYSEYEWIQIGHSLGGFHAHLCGYQFKHRVIAIDPPGSKEAITSLAEKINSAQCERHISFFMARNSINETNQHVGRLAYYSFNTDDPDCSNPISQKSLSTHMLPFFLQHISVDAPDPATDLPKGFFWQDPLLPRLLSPNSKKSSVPKSMKKPLLEPTLKDLKPDELPKSTVSAVNLNYQYNQDSWLVSILNTSDTPDSYTTLIIEGYKKVSDTQLWKKFIGQYEFKIKAADVSVTSSFHPKKYVASISITEGEEVAQSGGYYYLPSKSYCVTAEKAEQMIMLIKNDSELYQKAHPYQADCPSIQALNTEHSSHSPFLPKTENLHATNWCVNKLELATGIVVEQYVNPHQKLPNTNSCILI